MRAYFRNYVGIIQTFAWLDLMESKVGRDALMIATLALMLDAFAPVHGFLLLLGIALIAQVGLWLYSRRPEPIAYIAFAVWAFVLVVIAAIAALILVAALVGARA